MMMMFHCLRPVRRSLAWSSLYSSFGFFVRIKTHIIFARCFGAGHSETHYHHRGPQHSTDAKWIYIFMCLYSEHQHRAALDDDEFQFFQFHNSEIAAGSGGEMMMSSAQQNEQHTKKLLFCRGISYFWGSEPPSSDSYTICCHEGEKWVGEELARRTQVQSTKCRHFFLLFTFLSCEVLFCVWYSIRAKQQQRGGEKKKSDGEKKVCWTLTEIYISCEHWALLCVWWLSRKIHTRNKKEQQFRLHYRFCFRGCWLTC